MTAPTRSKEESMGLTRIAMRSAWFPLLIMVIVGLVIILPIIFSFGNPEAIPPLTLAAAAFVSTLVGVIAAAKFAVPKSLFKPRKNAQLVPRSGGAFAPQFWRWVGICLATQVAFGVVLVGLDSLGVKLGSSMNLVSALMSNYLANYLIAQRMLKNGDATLTTKA